MVIDENNIQRLIEENKNVKKEEILRIIRKSLEFRPLEIAEAAALLNCEDESLISEIKTAAKIVKEKAILRGLIGSAT
nr:[FeFe] hydrogenase H-cluster radical SAM maturase HydG [Candidatus Wallbacteria bacterium]